MIDSAQTTLTRHTGHDPAQPLSTGATFSGRSSYGLTYFVAATAEENTFAAAVSRSSVTLP